MGRAVLAVLLLGIHLVLLLAMPSLGQQSNSVVNEDILKESRKNNKFAQREASDDSLPLPQLDEEKLGASQCPQNLELRWQTEVGSSIYATPLISDINSDGKLEIVVSTFVHYLEVLEGADGEKLLGWPAQHQETVHSSALVYDIDKDGNKEVVLPTFNGEIMFFKSGGYMLPDKMTVPKFKVRKDWYVGLAEDTVDRSHPDVQDETLIEEAREMDLAKHIHSNSEAKKTDVANDTPSNSEVKKTDVANGTPSNSEAKKTDVANDTPSNSEAKKTDAASDTLSSSEARKTDVASDTLSSSEAKKTDVASDTLSNSEAKKTDVASDTVSNSEDKKTDVENDTLPNPEVEKTDVASDILSNTDALNQEGSILQRRLLQAEGNSGSEDSTDSTTAVTEGENSANETPTVKDEDPLEDDAASSFHDVFDSNEDLPDEYNYDYDDYVNEEMWGDEQWNVIRHERFEDLVEVDAHILATPVIADIDKDGIDEMVVAVSYFYDHEYYSSQNHAKELGENLDYTKYVAGAIVVFNLDTKQVKWEFNTDMSTDYAKHRAYIYSPPTVVDLDGDGYLEILVGTSIGFVYAITHDGQNRKNWPKLMGEVQSQVVAADINDDGKIEIVTTDSLGNVAAWTGDGMELWERHLKSLISQGPSVGDVDGDGHTDLVVPTTSGNIYVLRGSNGDKVGPYPFRTHGRVMSPALLVDLSKRGAERKGLTIAVGSFDGYFYLIDGPTGCAEAIDLGETSYSMALADNVDGGDDLDIIVTTMNGNVYCFQTPAPHHPLKAWPMQAQGRNVFASRHEREGIYVLPSSRRYRDEAGDNFHVQFEIVDKHTIPSGALGPYNVSVTLLSPGNYHGAKRSTHYYIYDEPGVYTVTVPGVKSRLTGEVLVEMLDKNSLYFSDEFVLTFHMRYYQILKWLLTLPLVLMAGMFLVFPPQEELVSLLPRDRHQL